MTSGRGHKYIFIICDVDTDFIYAVPIKSRKPSEFVRAFREGYNVLVRCGFEPQLKRLDHETSVDLINEIEAKGLNYELVPPGNHQQNPAERAIQTFKGHFISIINGIDSRFPDDAWDYLIPQTNMTLNLLQKCGVNTAHSAYSYIHGPFGFDAHSLAPLGCRSLVHERTSGKGGKRGAWGNRGRIGYYIGPAMKSYRTWCFYMPDTRATTKTDSAEFYPSIPLPQPRWTPLQRHLATPARHTRMSQTAVNMGALTSSFNAHVTCTRYQCHQLCPPLSHLQGCRPHQPNVPDNQG